MGRVRALLSKVAAVGLPVLVMIGQTLAGYSSENRGL